MATESQIRANRANALKSTGPRTPEGKSISSKNAIAHGLSSNTIVLEGESMDRFNDFASALILQFQPRNVAESFLVQTMTAARWRLLRIWGIQTAGFELEMARKAASTPSAAPPTNHAAVLAAITFQAMADNSGVLALQHRFEVSYIRQFNTALSMLLKLRAASDPDQSYPALDLATETWEVVYRNEANFPPPAVPGSDL